MPPYRRKERECSTICEDKEKTTVTDRATETGETAVAERLLHDFLREECCWSAGQP